MPKTSQDQSKDTNTDSVRFAWTRQLKQAWTRLKNLARVWSGAALFLPAGAPCPTTMILRVQTWGRIGYEGHPVAGFHVQADIYIYYHIFTIIYCNPSGHAFVTQKHITPRDSSMYAFLPQNFHGVRWCFYALGLLKVAHRKGPKYQKTWVSHWSFFLSPIV